MKGERKGTCICPLGQAFDSSCPGKLDRLERERPASPFRTTVGQNAPQEVSRFNSGAA